MPSAHVNRSNSSGRPTVLRMITLAAIVGLGALQIGCVTGALMDNARLIIGVTKYENAEVDSKFLILTLYRDLLTAPEDQKVQTREMIIAIPFSQLKPRSTRPIDYEVLSQRQYKERGNKTTVNIQRQLEADQLICPSTDTTDHRGEQREANVPEAKGDLTPDPMNSQLLVGVVSGRDVKFRLCSGPVEYRTVNSNQLKESSTQWWGYAAAPLTFVVDIALFAISIPFAIIGGIIVLATGGA